MALTVPRLTPVRMATFRCETPCRNIRRTSSTTVVAIIVDLSPEISKHGLRLGRLVVQFEDIPRIVGPMATILLPTTVRHFDFPLRHTSFGLQPGWVAGCSDIGQAFAQPEAKLAQNRHSYKHYFGHFIPLRAGLFLRLPTEITDQYGGQDGNLRLK
jgi:hypothetical protein